ncbi:MAG TPA: hypothetical protein VE737_06440 [Actinomycetota bacterium]|nr:hypothetical protein [Actinomycetota bacterium]
MTDITACLATTSTLAEDAAVRSIPGTVLAGLALSKSVLVEGAVSAADVTVRGSLSGELTPKARATFQVTAEGSRLTGHRRPGASVNHSVARRLREDERPLPRPARP